ncbi:MAG: response regulator [Alphaproteobacteria bacterium]|nr:response regulator [Alphaproteobacteria bacterium]
MGRTFSGDEVASILVVEADPLVASYIGNILRELRFVIAGIASSGGEALAIAELCSPDLALVDMRLAGPIDGLELVHRLQSGFGVPSIFLSPRIDRELERRAGEIRPIGFLQKPFEPSRAFRAIEAALGAPPLSSLGSPA